MRGGEELAGGCVRVARCCGGCGAEGVDAPEDDDVDDDGDLSGIGVEDAGGDETESITSSTVSDMNASLVSGSPVCDNRITMLATMPFSDGWCCSAVVTLSECGPTRC